MSNYKVDFKTKPMEWKTKYNGLVDKVLNQVDINNELATTIFAKDFLVNLNGWELTNFSKVDATVNTFPCIQIKYKGNICTEENAKLYMKCMSGTEFLPRYDFNYPKNCYIIFPTLEIYKPQFDETNGLVLFKVNRVNQIRRLYFHNLFPAPIYVFMENWALNQLLALISQQLGIEVNERNVSTVFYQATDDMKMAFFNACQIFNITMNYDGIPVVRFVYNGVSMFIFIGNVQNNQLTFTQVERYEDLSNAELTLDHID